VEIRRAARRAGIAAALVVVVWVALPVGLGGRTDYTVVSGHSMDGTLAGGDFVVTRTAAAYRVGDIVVYRVPAGTAGAGRAVVHRLVGGNGTTGWVTKGDNNPAVDPWHPIDTDVIGRVRLRVPAAGRLLLIARSPLGIALVAGIGAALSVLAVPDKTAGAKPAG
jgi:signal peptidase I